MANEVHDALTEVLCAGAQKLLAQVIEVERAELLGHIREVRDEAAAPSGSQRLPT